eukprot:8850071-Ditylum_brightwellii.AAC.1
MTNGGKHVKWHNSVQNHQNGAPLPVLDPQVEGYKPVELFQWEMCVQFSSCGVSMNNPTSDVSCRKCMEKTNFCYLLKKVRESRSNIPCKSSGGLWNV